jgi:ADP-heptose:LPS heptosyltransferase
VSVQKAWSRFARWLIWVAGRARRMRLRQPDIAVPLATLFRYGIQRPTRAPAVVPQHPERILVIRLDAMGDLIMSSPIFRELKMCFPESKITAIVQEKQREVLEGNPYVSEVICVGSGRRGWILQRLRKQIALTMTYFGHLRNMRFDLVLNPRLQYDFYGARYLTRLVAGNVTVEYATKASNDDLPVEPSRRGFTRITVLPRPKPQLEVLSNIGMVEYVTGKPCSSLPALYPAEGDKAFARRLCIAGEPGTIRLAIGFDAAAEIRKWPLERWAEVINRLGETVPISVFVIFPQPKAAEGRELGSMVRTRATLVGGATLRQLAALLELCDLYIGPDSGLAHMAAASNCAPVIVSPHPVDGKIDHPNSPALFGPFLASAQIVRPARGLSPCQGACDALRPHCILQVTAEEVVATALNAIRQLDALSHSNKSEAEQLG